MKIQAQMWSDFENWLLYIKRKRHSQKTSARYATFSRFKSIAEFFSTVEFDENGIARYIKTLIDRELSNSTVNKHIQVVNNLIRYLKLPLDKIELYTDNSIIERIPLTKEETIRLISIIIIYRVNSSYLNLMNKTIYLLFAETGCRAGEALDLKIKDVCFMPDTRHPYYVIFRNTKSKKDRKNKITRELYVMLNTLPRKGTLAFESYRGHKLLPQELNLDLKRRAKECGIIKPVHTHVFRHTLASGLDDLGVQITHIQKIMGHADIKTTQRYIHTAFDDLADDVEMLPLFISEASPQRRQDKIISQVQKVIDRQIQDLKISYEGNKMVIEVLDKSL
jgi:integrase